jgi:hypothetical protein
MTSAVVGVAAAAADKTGAWATDKACTQVAAGRAEVAAGGAAGATLVPGAELEAEAPSWSRTKPGGESPLRKSNAPVLISLYRGLHVQGLFLS